MRGDGQSITPSVESFGSYSAGTSGTPIHAALERGGSNGYTFPASQTRNEARRHQELTVGATRDTIDGVTTARRLHHTYEEYLGALEMSDVKLEYCDGEIYAMAGGTPAHADLAAAATRILGNALEDRCRVSSDLKVRIEATDLSVFPDVSVSCGERRFAAVDKNALVNPTLLVEVTSNSTEDYDRGEKLSHYKQCPSLQAVLIVSHRRRQITAVERVGAGFRVREFRSGEQVELTQPAVSFAVDELYKGIELDG